MIIPPKYQITPEILSIISQIEGLFHYFSSLTIPQLVNEKITRINLLKSSLYSARIEGNNLTLEDYSFHSDKLQKKEVENIISATKYIDKNIKAKTKISSGLILKIHRIVMKGLVSDIGCFRTEPGAIFNSSGVAVYVSPSPFQIKSLLDKLLAYINSNQENFPLVCVFISHLIFEKIHPFIDGNGRVGRLLISAILKSKNYQLPLIIPFEQHLDENKNDYYYHLDNGLSKTNDYLLFMLDVFLQETKRLKDQIEIEINKKETLLLPPRQEEIFNIINEHRIVSFDFVKRRFLKVPSRTLRYDLKKLLDQKLIQKIGKTKGSYYQKT